MCDKSLKVLKLKRCKYFEGSLLLLLCVTENGHEYYNGSISALLHVCTTSLPLMFSLETEWEKTMEQEMADFKKGQARRQGGCGPP